ncbi:tetratricopeptide repeat protein [Azospirillum doebereinerae]|uniref:Tetratricopeptide repeat protein n=1 Tax=Azospirillum doebereinerae TaxID=92933 RepID=A0A433J6M6_9PROT|nr:tetratricopeptide repeat protein [Azospirillum doebereinerae]RUQ68828.1 tetratricopeptide repeat protein [Azospirillum doebereinerae]
MATVAEALQVAVDHHRADRLDQAGEIYRRILAVDARNGQALHLLGLVERRLGNGERAIELIAQAAGILPHVAEIPANLGNAYRAAGRIDEAAAAYRRSIAVQPDLSGGYYNQGVLLCGQGGPRAQAEAIVALRRTCILVPDNPDVHHDLAIAHKQAVRLDEAIVGQRRALALRPDFAAAWMTLGNALTEFGDIDRALAAYARSLRVQWSSGDVHYNYGNVLYAAGRLEAAAVHYRHAIDGGLAAALVREAAVFIDLGRDAEAEASLRAALSVPGGDVPTAIDMLAALFIRQGRLDEARHFFSTFRHPYSNPPTIFAAECLTALAETYLAEGRDADALALLNRVNSHGSRYFTVKSVASLRRTLAGMSLELKRPVNPAPGRRRVGSSSLATHGRFAHNVFEYMLVRLYAETYGLTVETPDWVGGYYFDVNDPAPSGPLRPRFFPRRIVNELIERPSDTPLIDCDILSPLGPYRYPERHRARIQSWFRPRPVWTPWIAPAVERLRAMGNTVVALHIRRGDFVLFRYTITETDWYVDWLRTIWDGLDKPVLYIASDDPAIVADFAAFNPLTLADVAEPWAGLEYLQDFHVLANADILGVSAQSGFSRLAALLNTRARLFVEPEAEAGRVQPYSPWTPDDVPGGAPDGVA